MLEHSTNTSLHIEGAETQLQTITLYSNSVWIVKRSAISIATTGIKNLRARTKLINTLDNWVHELQ